MKLNSNKENEKVNSYLKRSIFAIVSLLAVGTIDPALASQSTTTLDRVNVYPAFDFSPFHHDWSMGWQQNDYDTWETTFTSGGGGGASSDVTPEKEPEMWLISWECAADSTTRELAAWAAYKAQMLILYPSNPIGAMIKDAEHSAEGNTFGVIMWAGYFGSGGFYQRSDSHFTSSHGFWELIAPKCDYVF